MSDTPDQTRVVVAALYRFTRFPDPEAIRHDLARLACAEGLRGTLIVAHEGLNGTVAGSREGIDALSRAVHALPGCAAVEWKESLADAQPFRRLKVKRKPEIVTMGVPDPDVPARTGTHVPAAAWNEVLRDPDTVVIDTRNDYETAIGSFEGAIDPGTEGFRDFPAWWEAHKAGFQGKRIAMFCTGGIRCEKASAWLIGQGVPEVRQLSGGILRYLEEVPETDSLWRGACFVFDERVAVGHGVRPGAHSLCHACGWPVSEADRAHPDYEEGVRCPACAGRYSDADRERFAERQRQIGLAAARGRRHLADG